VTFYHQTVKDLTDKLFPSNQQTEQIIRSRKFMQDHLADKVHLGHISGSAWYSRFHYIRLFKNHYGLTPLQYLTQLRITEAKRLLMAGQSVTDVCCELGFESVTSFASLFKKSTGQSPSAFKKSNIQ
jgi:AraC-like DNA-binding protein